MSIPEKLFVDQENHDSFVIEDEAKNIVAIGRSGNLLTLIADIYNEHAEMVRLLDEARARVITLEARIASMAGATE